MAELWQSWAEFQDSDDELIRFAEAIGFKYGQKAVALYHASYDGFKAWKEGLVENAA